MTHKQCSYDTQLADALYRVREYVEACLPHFSAVAAQKRDRPHIRAVAALTSDNAVTRGFRLT